MFQRQFLRLLFCLFPDVICDGVNQLLFLLQRAVQLIDGLQDKLSVNFSNALLQVCLPLFGFRKMYNELDLKRPPILCFAISIYEGKFVQYAWDFPHIRMGCMQKQPGFSG